MERKAEESDGFEDDEGKNGKQECAKLHTKVGIQKERRNIPLERKFVEDSVVFSKAEKEQLH